LLLFPTELKKREKKGRKGEGKRKREKEKAKRIATLHKTSQRNKYNRKQRKLNIKTCTGFLFFFPRNGKDEGGKEKNVGR